MPSDLQDLLPFLIVAVGFAAGFYYRHRISVKRQKKKGRQF